MENKSIKFQDLPFNWALCFNQNCMKSTQCLRHLVTATVPDNVYQGRSVWPNALKDGECKMFAEAKYVDMAWGFSKLFSNLRQQDYKTIIQRMKDHFGYRKYYRYNNGEKMLTPEEQQWIKDLFAEYGYTEDVTFDHIESQLQFPYPSK